MSYTKTTWNDLTAPAINASNLNKIEQGIYDNSIDITSINTLIGSSGTATTTQTDYTEGQLTQKLGLKYIKMKGQTSQDTYQGYNLCDSDTELRQGGTVSASDTTRNSISMKYQLKANTKYTFVTNINLSNFAYAICTGTVVSPWAVANQLSDTGWIQNVNHTTITTTEACYMNIVLRKSDNTALTPSTVQGYQYMVYEGEYSSSKAYEKYVGGSASPSPSFPQDVNVVRGSNVIKIGNKNLINKINFAPSGTYTDVTITNNNDGTLTLNGTTTANRSYYLSPSPYTFNEEELDTYTYKCFGLPNTCYTNIYYGSNVYGENTYNLNVNTAGRNYAIILVIPSGVTLSNVQIKPMFIRGSYTSSNFPSYIAHKEEDYYIDLPVENLLDYANNTIANAMLNTSGGIVTTSQCTTVWAKVKPNKTYTLSRDKGDRIVIGGTNTQPELNGSTTLIKNEDVTDVKEYTFTNGNYNYIAIYISRYTSTKPNWVKLEENSKATAYMDYGEKSLELCKIGTYQDYIYKKDGKWWKHKAIGKVTLDGTETWNYSSGNLVFYTDVINTLAKSNTSLYCTHYKPVDNSTTYTNMNSGEIKAQHDNSLNARLIIKNTAITSANDFKTWLASNNTSVYYQLVTPIEEEITYEPLLRQLDKLDKIGLYDISNISQNNSDMKMLLDFTICNDNYNGLREFIRS